jgi:hypothetical protein
MLRTLLRVMPIPLYQSRDGQVFVGIWIGRWFFRSAPENAVASVRRWMPAFYGSSYLLALTLLIWTSFALPLASRILITVAIGGGMVVLQSLVTAYATRQFPKASVSRRQLQPMQL